MNVLIVDDHDIVRRGIRDTLSDAFGDIQCGEAPDVTGAWKSLDETQWDAMILDISLGGESGLEFLKDFRKRDSGLPVLVLSMYPEHLMALRAIKAGANGYLQKDSATAELPRAITEIIGGKSYVSDEVTSEMVSQMAGQTEPSRSALESLSNREFQVMTSLASGHSSKSIGEELKISSKTVSTYRARIMKKMGFESNADIVRFAVEKGLIQ